MLLFITKGELKIVICNDIGVLAIKVLQSKWQHQFLIKCEGHFQFFLLTRIFISGISLTFPGGNPIKKFSTKKLNLYHNIAV